MINLPVLVLNQNYAPLSICNVRRAIVLLHRGKAESITNGGHILHTTRAEFAQPSVIRLVYMVKRPISVSKLSRNEVFLRDQYSCQYCGQESKQLTIDHVIPRVRGGVHSWENVVAACIPCNHKKAGRTPSEARMRLPRSPAPPRPNPYRLFLRHTILEDWRQFIPWAQ